MKIKKLLIAIIDFILGWSWKHALVLALALIFILYLSGCATAGISFDLRYSHKTSEPELLKMAVHTTVSMVSYSDLSLCGKAPQTFACTDGSHIWIYDGLSPSSERAAYIHELGHAYDIHVLGFSLDETARHPAITWSANR